MALIYNLKIYAKVDAGQRILSVPASRAHSVLMGLKSRGWKVKQRKEGDTITLFVLQ